MNRIKLLREEFGFTQQDLADRVNGSKSSIAMYESGTRNPSMDILLKLSEIFDCSIDYILYKSNLKNNSIIDNSAIIGMSREDYIELTESQKQQIKDFVKFIKNKGE